MAGPKNIHNWHDSFDGAEPAYPPPPPKQINAGDKKVGPPSPASGKKGAGLSKDSFYE